MGAADVMCVMPKWYFPLNRHTGKLLIVLGIVSTLTLFKGLKYEGETLTPSVRANFYSWHQLKNKKKTDCSCVVFLSKLFQQFRHL